MNIRPALLTDAAAVAAIHIHTWQSAYKGIIADDYLQNLSTLQRESSWNRRLSQKGVTTLVAEEDRRVAGFIAGGPNRDNNDDTTIAEVYAIYVEPTYSNRGIGSSLLREMLHCLQQRGFTEAFLWVLLENASARAFYEKQQMSIDYGKERQIEIGGQYYTELRYRCKMGA